MMVAPSRIGTRGNTRHYTAIRAYIIIIGKKRTERKGPERQYNPRFGPTFYLLLNFSISRAFTESAMAMYGFMLS